MNNFEKQIFDIIKKQISVTPRKSISVIADKIIKKYDNKNKLFIQPCSPYLTPIGNQKRSDLSLYCPVLNIDWRIECKSRQTIGLLGEIKSELDYVANIPEQLYCLVMTDNLLTPHFLNELNQNVIEKGLNNKVWIGTAKQFKKKLK